MALLTLDDRYNLQIADAKATFARLVEQAPRAARIALVGFPRVQDKAAAVGAGASAVVSKPFLAEDLLWQMRQCLARQRSF